MIISPANLDALFISFNKNFADAYMTSPAPLLSEIGSTIASNTRDQRYPFMQTISGAMRQWVGERQIQNVVVDGFVVTNLKWEDTVGIDRVDIEDDQYGVYSDMIIPNLARNAKLLPDQQIASIIAANPIGYDGVAFFNASHPIDPSGARAGVQSNTFTGKPLNATNVNLVQAAMMSFLGPDGIPMGSYGNTLLVPPSLKYTADTLANAAYFPDVKNGASGVYGTGTNIFKGQFNVVCSPYLTDSGDPATAVWYLLDTRDPKLRPFLWQEHTAPQLISLVDPSNSAVFFQDKFYFGVRSRGAAAPSLWFRACKVSGA